LLITNLDLGGQTQLACANLNEPLANIPSERQSVPVVEFWRAFPNAYETFQIKTAARMSATFPFVGPGVSLPTNPRRRVVDAGYFDNFGINLAAVWLYRHRKAIIDHTSGVVIIEVRAYPRRKEKLLTDPARFGVDAKTAKKSPELFTWALAEVSTPAEAIINLYSRGAYFRNDIQLDILNEMFNTELYNTKANLTAEPGKKFLTTVVFECDQEAALSWTLPARDYAAIKESFRPDSGEVKRLREWFGNGGTGK
jgi:hypothetical protein